MEDIDCINCDTTNFAHDITEPFICGECGEINLGIEVKYEDNE